MIRSLVSISHVLNSKRSWILAVALLFSLGLASCQTQTTPDSPPSSSSQAPAAQAGSVSYKDGRYEATSVGYAGGLRVAVTIEGGKIAAVEVIEHNEVGEQYYKPAIEQVPALILQKQSAEGIDTVAGSTMTTKGIVKAVQKALKQAKP